MSTTKMTIHRALSELKLIDAKIEKKINSMEPVGLYQKGKLIGGFLKHEDFEQDTKADYDSIQALIDRKVKIKSAIVDSNAKTKVTVAEKEISVADAITFKTVVVYKNALINRLKTEYKKYSGELNKKNEVISANCQNIIAAAMGKDNVKTDSKDVDAISKPYMEAHEFHMSDPIKVADKIKALEEEVSSFESEIDSVLSETNAVTFIEI